MNSYNILIVSTSFPPTSGGVAMAGMELATAFARRGHQVTVICAHHDKSAAPTCDERLTICPIGVREGERLTSDIIDRITYLWRSCSPDIVLINGLGRCAGDVVFNLAKNNRTPIIVRSHGSSTQLTLNLRHPPFFGIAHWLKSFLSTAKWIKKCSSFQQIVFLSSRKGIFSNFDRLAAHILHLHNISDIPNTFESIRLDHNSFRDRYGLQGSLFVYIAGFSPRKNQKEAVRAIQHSNIQGATFVFIGPCRNEYAAQTEQMAKGDPRFVFLYDIPRQDVLEAQNAADCCVLYATHEQQPLVLLEAMSCEKPWICTDVGSVSEMRGGIVLRRRRAKDLIQAIKTMQDPETRARFGREGYEQWIDKFSPGSVYARWDRLLEDVAAHKPVRGGY